MNKICVYVFCYENKMVYPVNLSNQFFNDVLDLLLISNDFTNHYVYIKDFNRLMFNKTRNKQGSDRNPFGLYQDIMVKIVYLP